MIAEKLLQIKHNIDTYSIYPEKVKLLVVSKRQPIEKMRECLLQGHTLFGENFVQEAQHKKELLQEGASFHLIGNLQKNKIKYCPQLFSFIHTLDNSVTAKLLNQAFVKSDQILQVLLQVNLSLEETKAGVVSFDNLQKLTEDVLELSNLKLVGLMSIGNPQAKAKETQALFSQLREYQEKIATQFKISSTFTELSMGMSDDYILALQEGATFIRLGTSLFGVRS